MMLIKVLFFLFNSLSVDMVLQVGRILSPHHSSELTALMLGSERPVVLAGDRNVETVVEGSSFSLECHVKVPVNIDTSVTIMWKHEDLVLQADNVRVRHDPNMNITFVKKTSVDLSKTSYSTYLAVAVTEKKYQGGSSQPVNMKLHSLVGPGLPQYIDICSTFIV